MDGFIIGGLFIGGWLIFAGVLLGLVSALKIIATGTP